jgi:hypothetical protein
MSKYEEALNQFIKETGFSKQDFVQSVKEFGEDYISYYQKRYIKVLENQNKIYLV